MKQSFRYKNNIIHTLTTLTRQKKVNYFSKDLNNSKHKFYKDNEESCTNNTHHRSVQTRGKPTKDELKN